MKIVRMLVLLLCSGLWFVHEAGAGGMTSPIPRHGGTGTESGGADQGGNGQTSPGQGGPEQGGKGPQGRGEMSSGTGFFVSRDGYIITNFHVVSDSTRLEVRVAGGKMYPAKIVATDPNNDIALIKIEAKSAPLPLAPTRNIKKGTEVFTLGYPLPDLEGGEQKATFGRINALSGIQGDIRYLQMDVPIQPGNSGGPLISSDGFVIGITSAMLSQIHTLKTAGVIPQNVNYAIKSEYIRPLLEYARIKLPARKPVKDAIRNPAQFEASVVHIIGAMEENQVAENNEQGASSLAPAERRMVGIWEEYSPGTNVVQFYPDHTMRIYLTAEEGRDKDMHYIKAKWSLSDDMTLTLDISAGGKQISQSVKVAFKKGEMWLLEDDGPATKNRRIDSVPDKYKW